MAQESWNRDQEETGCELPQGPILCANNCGFFGSETTMNLCSKCYRDIVLKASSVQAAFEKTQMQVPPSSSASSSSSSSSVDNWLNIAPERQDDDHLLQVRNSPPQISIQPEEEQPQRPTNRCFMCNKRIGLTGFKCRCGDFFCSMHRHSDQHNCSFDYKAVGREAIARANPIVKASKIDKI